MAKIPTFDDWAASEVRRSALQKILDDPIFQEAVETLLHAFDETAPPVVSTNANGVIPNAVDLNNLLALRSAHRSGFKGAFRALTNLTKEKPLRPTKDPIFRDFVPLETGPSRQKPKPQSKA